MSRHREWDPACKVYIGNLRNNASKNELEDTFSKYGPLRNIWVARNPPGFAFVEFEDPRDAEDAVRGLDGTRCCGSRIIVEMSNGKSRNRDRDRDRDRDGRDSFRRRSPSYRFIPTFLRLTSPRSPSPIHHPNSHQYILQQGGCRHLARIFLHDYPHQTPNLITT